jgi:hypothetical protein
MLVAVECFYIVASAFLKLAIGYFFLRIAVEQTQRRIIYAVLIVFTTYSFGFFFIAVFQCGVAGGALFWQRKLSHQCLPLAVGEGLSYTHAGLSAGADITFLALSFPLVANAKILKTHKLSIYGVLGLATV